MNILIVSAHHDDLELGCGGAVARMIENGHKVISLVMTHSGYSDPNGVPVRCKTQARTEGEAAAKVLGYELVAYDEDTLDLPATDANAGKIVEATKKWQIDAIFSHWYGDTHPVHQRVAAMSLNAARRVPRVYGFASNSYLGPVPFHPTSFVTLEERHWERKIAALKCYHSEFSRAGEQWVDFLDRQTLNYGLQIGAPRAEGFVTIKNLVRV